MISNEAGKSTQQLRFYSQNRALILNLSLTSFVTLDNFILLYKPLLSSIKQREPYSKTEKSVVFFFFWELIWQQNLMWTKRRYLQPLSHLVCIIVNFVAEILNINKFDDYMLPQSLFRVNAGQLLSLQNYYLSFSTYLCAWKSGLLQSVCSLPIVCFLISLVSGNHWQGIGVREKTEAPFMRSHPSLFPD